MRTLKFLGTSLLVTLALFTAAKAEARAHFSFGFFGMAPTVVGHRVAPVVVEEYYGYEAPVLRRPPCCERRVYMERPCYREVHVYPSYREHVIVQPRPVFTFGLGF